MGVFDFYLEMLLSWEWYVLAIMSISMLMLTIAKLRMLEARPPNKDDNDNGNMVAQALVVVIYLLTWPIATMVLWYVAKYISENKG